MEVRPAGKPARVYIGGFNIERDNVAKVAGEIRELILDSEANQGNALSESLKEVLFKIYQEMKAA